MDRKHDTFRFKKQLKLLLDKHYNKHFLGRRLNSDVESIKNSQVVTRPEELPAYATLKVVRPEGGPLHKLNLARSHNYEKPTDGLDQAQKALSS